MVKRKNPAFSLYARFLLVSFGLLWLIAGVFVAFSPKIAPKMLQWNYVFAWIFIFGFPCSFLLWLGFHGIYGNLRGFAKEKSDNESSQKLLKQETRLCGTEKVAVNFQVEDIKPKERTKSVDMVEVESVYSIPTKDLQNNKEHNGYSVDIMGLREQLTPNNFQEVYLCRHCQAIISKNEYETYGGLCHGCYMDFKREVRRSGLFGADRASTW